MTASNQSEEHAMMVARIKAVLIARGWIVRKEELHADIVAFLPGCHGVWAVENERRGNAYWISRNLLRNAKNGAIGIVFVTETKALAEKVGRIVKSVPLSIAEKTVVVPVDEFTDGFIQTVMERRQ